MIVAAELLASEAWDDWMKEAGPGTGENETHQQRGVPKCHFWLYKIPTDQIFPANTLWMWSFGASSLLTTVPSTIELELRIEFNLIWRSIIRGLPPLSGNGRKDFFCGRSSLSPRTNVFFLTHSLILKTLTSFWAPTCQKNFDYSFFEDMRDEEEFTDMTLACEDCQLGEAHKVILAGPSPKKHQNPLIWAGWFLSPPLKHSGWKPGVSGLAWLSASSRCLHSYTKKYQFLHKEIWWTNFDK